MSIVNFCKENVVRSVQGKGDRVNKLRYLCYFRRPRSARAAFATLDHENLEESFGKSDELFLISVASAFPFYTWTGE